MNSREWLISCGVVPSKTMCDALDKALDEQVEACAKAVVYDLGGNERSDLDRSIIAITCRKARL